MEDVNALDVKIESKDLKFWKNIQAKVENDIFSMEHELVLNKKILEFVNEKLNQLQI